jgi:hypothetical protein
LVRQLRKDLDPVKTVYISIGNSDDKLSQAHWAAFAGSAQGAIRRAAMTVHGEWASLPWSSYQNACWCIEVTADSAEHLKMTLAHLAADYRQDSIAWAECPTTEFLGSGDGGAA